MNNKNTQYLLKKYPKLFRQHTLPMSETCMCWLFECGDGWFYLLDKICGWLQFNSEHNLQLFPKVEFTQVKEKFATLRLYHTFVSTHDKHISIWNRLKKAYECLRYGYSSIDDRHRYYAGELAGAIAFAEALSEDICEECGKPGTEQTIDGWMSTLCPKCTAALKNKKGR